MEKNIIPHRPPHIYADDTWYFITASTVKKAHYLATDNHLRLWTNALRALVEEFGVTLRAWVVLRDHYHLLIRPRLGHDIGRFIGRLNGCTSREFNLMDHAAGRHVWYNYWDTCIRTDADHWMRFNYIHNNPVKHGYVKQHADWEFSSYHYYLRTKGAEWLDDCWQQYPVVDYVGSDDFPSHPTTGMQLPG